MQIFSLAAALLKNMKYNNCVYIYIRKQIKFSAGKAFTCEKYHKNTQGKILADLKKGKTRRNYFFLQTTPL